MQYGPDRVPVSNVSVIIGPPTTGPAAVPVTTTEEIIEPPIYEPLTTLPKSGGNVIPTEPYAVAVAYNNDIVTYKTFELNFVGNSISVTNDGNGVSTISLADIDIILAAGNGISVATANNISTITNTGVLEVSGGNGISTATVDGVATITNTGILNVLAGNSIAVSTTNGNATVTNTFTETVYDGGNWSGSVTPDRNNGTVHKYTLTGNITLNVPANMSTGQSLTLILTQGSGGNKVMTANSSYKFASAYNDLSVNAGDIDMLNIFTDGTIYYVTLTVSYT